MAFPDFRLLNEKTSDAQAADYATNIAGFAKALASAPMIRVYAANSTGYGHQSSSINILRRLTGAPSGPWQGFGYAGRVEVCYLEGGKEPTLRKLYALLPELEGKPEGVLDGAKLKLVEVKEGVSPPEWVSLGFCGGYDGSPINLRNGLKIATLVVTQPFKYGVALNFDEVAHNWVLTGEAGADDPLELNLDVDDYETLGIPERAFLLGFVPLTAKDWDYYIQSATSPEAKLAIETVQYLTDPQRLAQLALMPLYGVNYPGVSAFSPPASTRIFLAMATARAALAKVAVKPPLLVNFGSYTPGFNAEQQYSYIASLLAGGMTVTEAGLLTGPTPTGPLSELVRAAQQDVRQTYQARLRSIAFTPAAYQLQDYRNGAQAVEALVTWLAKTPSAVGFLQLQFVPPPVFNHAMRAAALPAIFEGNNTANLALSTGHAYLNTVRIEDRTAIRYPVGFFGDVNATAMTSKLQATANRIQDSLAYWPPLVGDAPNLVMGELIAAVQDPRSAPSIYFGSISEYYQKPYNDKFALAASVAGQFLGDGLVRAARRVSDVPPLDALYAQLQELATQGRVDLMTDVFAEGGIHDYYTTLLATFGNGLVVTRPVVGAREDGGAIVEVSLTGATDAFAAPTTVAFAFTAATGEIASQARYAAVLPWSLDGVPWIVFDAPFVDVLASNGVSPPSSAIGGAIRNADFELTMGLPARDGRVVVRGEFTELKTISDFFALAGGVDLLASLPSALQALAGLGVRYVELAYATATSSIDYVSVRIETAAPWRLMNGLALTDLSAVVTVLEPAGAAQTTAAFRGMLRIGDKPDAARIAVSADLPQFRIAGQLADPELPLDDLIQVFWPSGDPAWPGDKEPVITELAMGYAVDTGDYNLAIALLLEWPIVVAGTEVFRIRAISLALDGGKLASTGKLAGSVIVLPDSANLEWALAADYASVTRSWKFQAQLVSGVIELPIGDFLAYYLGWKTDLRIAIDGLGATIDTATNNYEFTAKTADAWHIPIDTGVDITGNATIGYRGAPTLPPPQTHALVEISRGRCVMLPAPPPPPRPGPYGEIGARIQWRGIDLKVFYNFDPDYRAYGITWGIFTGEIETKLVEGKEHQLATLSISEGFTLGDMVETMVSWATGSAFGLGAPWNVLSSIPFSAFSLTYDFTAGKVYLNVNLGPIELGFARIDAITLTYNSGAENPDDNGVLVALKGSFRWQSNPDAPLGWDATKPETTKAPPGGGNKYLDLRLLALGQHVTMPCFATADTVQKAIACMTTLPKPEPGKIPPITFAENSNWLIGTDFGVLALGGEDNKPPTGYFVTLQAVFNDPVLYGLRLALDGEPAKVFKGLDFQVMYRQVSSTVGVYQADIKLPDIMRRLSVGAYTITLPVFGIAVYTNGDFQIDVGFPWNQDFSRSFTVEAIVAPGIPLIGSAGFYFGKLSSASTNRVPKADNGTFNPVIVFGFGMQVGVGKSIEYGPLKAGFSITAFGIVEGVIAKWNPYALGDGGTSGATQLQGAYYFWLRGTVGVIGKIYGSVDFAIIKADVNVDLRLMVQLTYESYVSIAITAMASVDVSVSIKINLGLFKITIDFSFSLRIKETFTIETHGTPPWRVAAANRAPGLRAPATARLRAFRAPAAIATGLTWSNLVPAVEPAPLTGYLTPAIAVAKDEWSQGEDPAAQLACYVGMFVIDSVPGVTRDRTTSARKAAGALADTSFEVLAKLVLRWAIAAIQPAPMTAAQIDALHVRDVELLALQALLATSDANPTPVPPPAVEAFLSQQVRFTVGLPPDRDDTADATYFPMAPRVRLTVPAYGAGYPGSDYTFAGYNAIDGDGLGALRRYFDQLAIQVQSEAPPAPRALGPVVDRLSMAEWIEADYFLLLARQLVQAARDGLRDFQYPLAPGDTPGGIADWVNRNGAPEGGGPYTFQDLFVANPGHALTPGARLTIGARHAIASSAETFRSITDDVAAGAFTAAGLALANAAAAVLRTGATIAHGDQVFHVAAGDTLVTAAGYFELLVSELLTETTVVTQPELLAAGAVLALPRVTTQALAADTFTSIAGRAVLGGALTPSALATQSAGLAILTTGAEITYQAARHAVRVGQSLGDVANALDTTVAALLAGSDALTLDGLIAIAAVLDLPPFVYPTVAGDTLLGVAARFAVAVDLLGEATENATIVDLFAAGDYLHIPHLAAFRVSELIAEAQRTLALQQLSGMASRYYLHGLRLPTGSIEPKALGLWVKEIDDTLQLPPMAGLYALTGQQLAVPEITADAPFTFTYDRSAGPDWLRFEDAAGAATDKLEVKVTAGSVDDRRITTVLAKARAGAFAIPLDKLGAATTWSDALASYPLPSSLIWQAALPVALPYGTAPVTAATARVWQLPTAMLALPGPGRAAPPRFAPRIARYDEATGSTVTSGVGYYGWASVLAFSVKRVPPVPGSPSTLTTYELAGAGDLDILLLERLLADADDTAIDQLVVTYAPSASSSAAAGMQSDVQAAVTFGIAQVNLSTDTRPPAAAMAARFADPTARGLLNTPIEFLRLLWEASITRGGGFYLYYDDAADGRGLPDRLWNDNNEATLGLVIVFAKPAAVDAQNRVTSYTTSLVVGEDIDLSASILFAEADAPVAAVTPGGDDTLAGLAYRYYSDVADIAEANATAALAAGKPVAVNAGVYQAPPSGISLAAVAARFATTVAALQAANPQYGGGLPDPLVYPAAIFLPELALVTGTSAHTASLADIAGYYGEGVDALAADNAAVAGLFAATISVPGGPRVRTSTVAAGVQPVIAERRVPSEVPSDPSAPGYADAFLANAFSLLSYRVMGNAFFIDSNLGLPAGPSAPPGDPPSAGKLRAPRHLVADDVWTYRQAVPYPRFVAPQSSPDPRGGRFARRVAKGARHRNTDAANPTPSPYLGVGDLLQVAFSWVDTYGNTLVTNLSSPADGGPSATPPIVTGYTDALLGLATWPSIAGSWQVGQTGGVARAALDLSFDVSRYDGLLSAAAASATQVVAVFTQALDPASATDRSKYKLVPDVAITAAALNGDRQSVTLTTAALAANVRYTLTAAAVENAQGTAALDGQATFDLAGDPAARSSSVAANAAADLGVFDALHAQLTDPNGIRYVLETTLLGDGATAGRVTLPAAQVALLLGWLFDAPASIAHFLADREAFRTGVPAPVGAIAIDTELAAGALNPAQIYPLTMALVVERTGGVVAGGLEGVAGMRRAVTAVAPATDKLAGGGDTLALTAFAAAFEAALSVPGAYQRKVATGVDRARAGAASDGSAIWSVRVGVADGQAISYRVSPPSDETPAVFAPRPISRELQSRQGVAIYDYTTGTGISTTVSRTLDFIDIDMDLWGRSLLGAVDDVLSPALTAATLIVARDTRTPYLDQMLAQKAKLAAIVSQWMIPVFRGETASPAEVREVYRQQMLSALSNAYTTRAGIRYLAAVTADIDDPLGAEPPRLYGGISDSALPPSVASQISLTSPKLELSTGADRPLAFLLSAPEALRGAGGEILPAIDLHLTYAGAAIEHQIGAARGGYQPSSWLSFVIDDADSPLRRALGTCSVPLVLRTYPTSPTLADQAGAPSDPDAPELADLTRWTYTFTYELPVHYPQDRVYADVEFNVGGGTARLAAMLDAFPELAEFITVFPSVDADLRGILATIDAATDPVKDKDKIHDAAVALASFVDLLGRITTAAAGAALAVESPRLRAGIAALAYAFQIDEGSADLDGVQALLVTLVGAPPAGIGDPDVLVDPARYDAEPRPAVEGSFAFVYKDRATGQYLTAADGQMIPGRTIVLPAMDVLERQDTKPTLWVTRNEELIPGRPTADPFVYRSPDVTYQSAYLPTIGSDTAVRLPWIGSSEPVTRTLDDQLATLFAALLAHNTQPTAVIQVEARYDYQLRAALAAVSLPVLFQPPVAIQVAGTGDGSLAAMIAGWASAIRTWFDDTTPSGTEGTLRFDLTIMSSLTANPTPILRLSRLVLPIVYVAPPLATIQMPVRAAGG
jgi:hypothetical protein